MCKSCFFLCAHVDCTPVLHPFLCSGRVCVSLASVFVFGKSVCKSCFCFCVQVVCTYFASSFNVQVECTPVLHLFSCSSRTCACVACFLVQTECVHVFLLLMFIFR